MLGLFQGLDGLGFIHGGLPSALGERARGFSPTSAHKFKATRLVLSPTVQPPSQSQDRRQYFLFPSMEKTPQDAVERKVSASLRRLVSLEAMNTIFETLLLQHLSPLSAASAFEAVHSGHRRGGNAASHHIMDFDPITHGQKWRHGLILSEGSRMRKASVDARTATSWNQDPCPCTC